MIISTHSQRDTDSERPLGSRLVSLPKSGVLKNAPHRKKATQITLVYQADNGAVAKDDKDDGGDNLSFGALISHRTAWRGIMGPFNLAWKTRVILVRGLLPTSTLSLPPSSHIPTWVYMYLSTNPPIVIYPRLRHSSWVLEARGDMFTLGSDRNREDLTVMKTEPTRAYILTCYSKHTAAAVFCY